MSEETKDQAEATEATPPAASADAIGTEAQADAIGTEAQADASRTEAQADATSEAQADAAEAKADAADESKTSVQQSDDDGAVLDATGRERPRFLLGFPKHADLSRLAAAFEAGNYALVRAEAEVLAERTDNPAVRDAALELRRRIAPDPLAKYLLALTAALLLSLAYFAYHH